MADKKNKAQVDMSESEYWSAQMRALRKALDNPNSYENNWDYYD